MPAINLTNNTDLNLNGSSGDGNAAINRYLQNLLTFKTPPSLDAIANLPLKEQKQSDFPMQLSAAGEGKFAVEGTVLDIQLGPCASLGLLKDGDAARFLASVNLPGDPSSAGLVSFTLRGTLSAGESLTTGDFAFGIARNGTVALTSYYEAAPGDTLGGAVEKAVSALTIPHDLTDLKSLPAGALCQLEAGSTLKFTAGLTYNFLNDPLAAVAISKLPSFAITAAASATVEGAVAHTSGHTLTIAKLSDGLLHVAVGLAKTDDFETSLTVSTGVAASVGGQDALAFLLDRMDPDSKSEADSIAGQMKDAAQFRLDIKSAIDKSLAASLGASLKAALERCTVQNRAFVFEIDLTKLNEESETAVSQALTGDFTAMTRPGALLKGIQQLDSSLTVAATDTHTLALHFLGIFNAASINQFVAKSKVSFTSDTHEIVLCDETLEVLDNNLAAEKLRKVVLKDITLTLPASANTKDAKTPITLAFLDRQASASHTQMTRFVNVLQAVGAPGAGAARSLLGQKLKHYGVCSLFLGLSLDPGQCRRLFIGSSGEPFDWWSYITRFCEAEKTILAGGAEDSDDAYRLKLFHAGGETWQSLRTAGDAPNMTPILRGLGMSDAEAALAVTDAMTATWWAEAMAGYAAALAKGQSLEGVGKALVKDSNLGYDEPWMILAAWNLLAGGPEITARFASTLLETAAAAH